METQRFDLYTQMMPLFLALNGLGLNVFILILPVLEKALGQFQAGLRLLLFQYSILVISEHWFKPLWFKPLV
jgi:hypothetical protein